MTMNRSNPTVGRGLPRHRPAKLALLVAFAALALTGCKSKEANVASASGTAAVAARDGWAGRQGVTEAIALLNAGDAQGARKRLMAVLMNDPGDGIARRLIDQIDKDPKLLLGAQSFSYVMKVGDSFSSLAQEFLGDPMLFFALARYNQVAIPSQPPVGSSIRIPGKAPAVAKKPAARPAAPRKPPIATAKAAPAPAAAKPATTAADPARAAKLRGMALAAMNGGAIDRAVALLRQAHSADPNSTAIRSDLNRALRIQGSLRRN
jgi:hypothetical protein